MANHSEGPWSVDRTGILNSDGDNIFVQEDGVCWWKNPNDAYLVAALPDLLEALKRLVYEAKADGMDERAGWDCWVSLADKAIAKAEEQGA
ncbi:hypothetical protein [Agrobacterium tumefaciens]|uniref:hypothetical protein n=1 Tax=Agrobacterium tumefaciens TaxID=358 RepID=UPI000555BBC2|nr:hypothetical protein [Agrobacterium tumefaciens]